MFLIFLKKIYTWDADIWYYTPAPLFSPRYARYAAIFTLFLFIHYYVKDTGALCRAAAAILALHMILRWLLYFWCRFSHIIIIYYYFAARFSPLHAAKIWCPNRLLRYTPRFTILFYARHSRRRLLLLLFFIYIILLTIFYFPIR